MTRQLPKLLENLQTHPNSEHLFIFRQPGDLWKNLALCEALENSILPRLTWVGGTGEGWWEVDDFSRAFRRLSNLKMASWRSATTARGGWGRKKNHTKPYLAGSASALKSGQIYLSSKRALKAPVAPVRGKPARAHLVTDKASKGYTPQKPDPIQFCFHARKFSYLPLRRFWFSTSRWEILERSSFWSPAGPEEVVLALCNKENRDETNLFTSSLARWVSEAKQSHAFREEQHFRANLRTRTFSLKAFFYKKKTLAL